MVLTQESTVQLPPTQQLHSHLPLQWIQVPLLRQEGNVGNVFATGTDRRESQLPKEVLLI